ncbi:hypothetical protein [Gemella morbillorum]|uniref:hypothetical protein n=1 Tax=Gemella morbillorum TaxID=29391 RepID=UPI0023F47D7B|nr:hypothetical protein [Gemella morbillorum]
MSSLHQLFVSYGLVLYTVILAVVAYVGVAVKTYVDIQDGKVINKEIRLLQKTFPELKDILDFIYKDKGIAYSKNHLNIL